MHGIVAIGHIELPMSAEIHTSGGRQAEAVSGASAYEHHCRKERDAHRQTPFNLRGNLIMKSAYGVMCAAGRPQIVRTADPDAALERLETHAYPFCAPHGLRSAGNLAIREIGL